jgi:hypothetical protein
MPDSAIGDHRAPYSNTRAPATSAAAEHPSLRGYDSPALSELGLCGEIKQLDAESREFADESKHCAIRDGCDATLMGIFRGNSTESAVTTWG